MQSWYGLQNACVLWQIEHNCLISFYSLHNQFSYRYTYQLHTENEITDAFKYTCIYFYIEYLTFQNYFVAVLINLEKSFSTCFFLTEFIPTEVFLWISRKNMRKLYFLKECLRKFYVSIDATRKQRRFIEKYDARL